MANPDIIDTVSIILPRRRESGSLARLATTAVACQAGLNLDQADDLNTATDEIVRVLVTEETTSGSFTIRYMTSADNLEIVAGSFAGPILDGDSEASRYRRFVLEKVSDRLDENRLSDGLFNVRIIKHI